MNLFKKYFYITINEDNVAGAGGVFGDTGSVSMFPGGSDSYAPGDARIPTFIGSKPKKKRKKRKKRKGRKSKKSRASETFTIFRRNLNSN